jgi:hypothetical protein
VRLCAFFVRRFQQRRITFESTEVCAIKDPMPLMDHACLQEKQPFFTEQNIFDDKWSPYENQPLAVCRKINSTSTT